MFERYTEKARRTIFYARYEASQFGSPYIETEHLLLGLLRDDPAVANRFLRRPGAFESIRRQVEARLVPGQPFSTSVDIPLSHETKRVLVYGAEEAERLKHPHIGNEHLLLGMLREENCFAARLLREQGVTLASVREQVLRPEDEVAPGEMAGLDEWLAECEALGGIHVARQERVGTQTAQFAVYAGDSPKGLTEIQQRIARLVSEMEQAIANHEFEKARRCSEEERGEREKLRIVREQIGATRVPSLCIEVVGHAGFSELRHRCDEYIAEGVAEVWLLDLELRRAYTVTEAEGLRECRGEVLRAAGVPVELSLRQIFGD